MCMIMIQIYKFSDLTDLAQITKPFLSVGGTEQPISFKLSMFELNLSRHKKNIHSI